MAPSPMTAHAFTVFRLEKWKRWPYRVRRLSKWMNGLCRMCRTSLYRSFREGRQPQFFLDGGDFAGAATQNFVWVSLVSHIPDDPVMGACHRDKCRATVNSTQPRPAPKCPPLGWQRTGSGSAEAPQLPGAVDLLPVFLRSAGVVTELRMG